MTSEKRFYVYTLARPDGTVFYVGKGTGYRIDDHERDARRGEQSHKCRVIRKIWSEGGTIQKEKVAFFDTEEEAYCLEMQLIASIGRDTLTNYSNGGEGRGVGHFGPSSGLPRMSLPLEEQDREAIAAIRDYYGVHSDADAIRIALRETLRAIRRQSTPKRPQTTNAHSSPL